MKITAEQLRLAKEAPNSCYGLIKPQFLFHSNRLEGSTFTEPELQRLVDEGVVSGEHGLDDVLETVNSIALFDFMVDTLDCPLADNLLAEMNRILFRGTREEERGFSGHYKLIANRIRGSRIQTALPSDVPAAMAELLPAMDSRHAGFEGIARNHARFEHIHPFQNGNGRIGRVLMLRQCILAEHDLIVVDCEFERDYKTGLEIAQADGDFRFHFDALEKCARRFDAKMRGFGVDKMLPTAEEMDASKHALAGRLAKQDNPRQPGPHPARRIDQVRERIEGRA